MHQLLQKDIIRLRRIWKQLLTFQTVIIGSPAHRDTGSNPDGTVATVYLS